MFASTRRSVLAVSAAAMVVALVSTAAQAQYGSWYDSGPSGYYSSSGGSYYSGHSYSSYGERHVRYERYARYGSGGHCGGYVPRPIYYARPAPRFNFSLNIVDIDRDRHHHRGSHYGHRSPRRHWRH